MLVNPQVERGSRQESSARGAAPRHAVVADHIRSAIASGEWKTGDLLPSESALIDMFSVSRTVIRQAMQTLETEGLIWRKSGKGTFVREPAGALFSGTPIASGDDLLRAGKENRLITLERAEIPADGDVAAGLRIAEGDLVTLRSGVRSFGGQPFAYQREHIPVEIGRRTLVAEQVESMLENFRDNAGVDIVELTQAASAVAANEDVAARLDLAVGAPVLQIDWTGFARDGAPVVFSRTRYRSDRYHHVNRIPINPRQ